MLAREVKNIARPVTGHHTLWRVWVGHVSARAQPCRTVAHSIEESRSHCVEQKGNTVQCTVGIFSHTRIYANDARATKEPRHLQGGGRRTHWRRTQLYEALDVEGSFKERSVVLAVARASAQFFSGDSESPCKFFFPSVLCSCQ